MIKDELAIVNLAKESKKQFNDNEDYDGKICGHNQWVQKKKKRKKNKYAIASFLEMTTNMSTTTTMTTTMTTTTTTTIYTANHAVHQKK